MMMIVMRTAALAAILSSAAVAGTAAVRGSNPQQLAAFAASQTHFACADGSGVVPASAVNDDYCDCPDGSDEPGTSACDLAAFYCANEGHIPASIRSSAVNDGVCDPQCCDGSDEYSGRIQCPNTCAQAAAVTKKKTAAIMEMTRKGARRRRDLITAAKQSIEHRVKETAQLRLQLNDISKQFDQISAIKSHAESLDAQRRAADARRHSLSCESRLERAQSDAAAARSKTSNCVDRLLHLSQLTVADIDKMPQSLRQAPEIVALRNTLVAAASSDTQTSESNDMNNDSENTYFDKSDNDVELDLDRYTSTNPCVRDDTSITECLFASTTNATSAVYQAIIAPWIWPGWSKFYRTITNMFDPQAIIRNVSQARDRYKTIDDKRRDVQKRLDELVAMDTRDFGPNGEWTTLHHMCISFDDPVYTYEICLMNKATQKAKHDHSEVNLGTFTRWEHGDNHGVSTSSTSIPSTAASTQVTTGAHGLTDPRYNIMMFENGLQCWNGPKRSTRVVFACGVDTAIVSVEEPNKCEYLVKAVSPAVCVMDGDVPVDASASATAQADAKVSDRHEL